MPRFAVSRRALAGLAFAAALPRTGRAAPVLRIGDQKGGAKSLRAASGAL